MFLKNFPTSFKRLIFSLRLKDFCSMFFWGFQGQQKFPNPIFLRWSEVNPGEIYIAALPPSKKGAKTFRYSWLESIHEYQMCVLKQCVRDFGVSSIKLCVRPPNYLLFIVNAT